MAIDIVLDTIPISVPDERTTAIQLFQLAKQNTTRELFRATRSGLVRMGSDDQFVVRPGDVFISREGKREPFVVFNLNTIAAVIALLFSAFSLIFYRDV